jgi:signal transduction histidine kinase
MYGIRRFPWLAPNVLAAVVLSASGAAAQPQQWQVLTLYSMRPDATVVSVSERVLPKRLNAGLSGHLDYYAEFIDQARYSDRYDEVFSEYLGQKYAEHHLNLVIAMDHDALAFVARHRAALFDSVPLVFFSSRPSPPQLPTATGVNAVINLRDTLALARALQPDLRRVFVITGADRSYELLARAELGSFESQLSITYLSALTTTELERRLANLPPQSMVYFVHVTRDGANANFDALDYLDRISAVANAPTYSWVDSAMGHGVVGGSLRSLEAQIEAVAVLALRVLSGEPANRIPIQLASLNVRQVDWRQLRRWGISENRVPPGATLLFREPTVWERYRRYIVGGSAVLLIQAVLIVGLLAERRMRRLGEVRLREQQAVLLASYDRIRDLGARLLDAQERERVRIARELQEDVSQRLMVLAWDVERLREGAQGSARQLAADVVSRATEIAGNLNDMSHTLHPDHLSFVGIVPAIDELLRELSRADITVEFVHEGLADNLRWELQLCLYRVVEEALRNVMKHSKATHGMVCLGATPTEVRLTVSDEGVGFDVSTAWIAGVGIISMRERILGLGGSFEISSEHGRGTRLHATVPNRVTRSTAAAV